MKILDSTKKSLTSFPSPSATFGYFLVFMLTILVAGCSGSGSDSQGVATTVPVFAKTGPILAIRVNHTANLDGSKSNTSAPAPLSYNWSFSHRPDLSEAILQGATTANPFFVADVKGVYMAQLIVSANGMTSQRAIQTVVVTSPPGRLTGPFNHHGLSSDCVQCHTLTLPENTRVSPAKSPNHIATSNLCQACHTPQGAAIIPFTDHLEVFGNCSQCHDGITAVGKSEFHLPTDAECDSCHNTTSFLELAPDGSFDHTSIIRACEGCHNGTVAIGKTPSLIDTPPGTHPDTSSDCGYCHTTAGFLPAFPDHTDPGFVDNCTSCHDGSTAKGEPNGHPVMSVECDSCHSTVTFSMAGIFNHSLLDPTVQACETCHNNNANNSINARGKGSAVPTHPPTTSDCGSCHNTETFNPAFIVDHTNITTDCGLACHIADGSGTASGMPLATIFHEHMPTTEDCSVCHTPGTFSTGTFTHGPLYIPAKLCSDCHNDLISVGKLLNHLPTNQECDSCHLTTSFLPATFTHVGITDTCETCHNGTTAIGKINNHLPTVQNCDACHADSNVDNSTFKDTPNFAHTGIIADCESCHSGNTAYVAIGAIGKSPDHIPAQNQCDVCHTDTTTGGFVSAATFIPAVHDGFTQGCEGCHISKFLPTANSAQSIIKATSHLPTSQDCYLCHTISSFSAADTIFAHTSISGNCSSCHDGSMNNVASGAIGKAQAPTPHPATTADCGSCHAIGNNFTDGTFDHSGIVNNCSSCHGDTTTSTPVGPMKNPGHLPTTQDCSICHVPGTFLNAVFDHTGIVDNCASCHNGTDATGMPSVPLNHPDPLGKDCSTCHNTTAFAGAKYDHTGIVNGCATCHDGATAKGKTPPPNHVPTNGDCSDCHQTTGFLPATFDHVGIVNNCSSCHGTGFAIGKSATHIATIQDCGLCHNTRTFTGAVFDHTGVVNGCDSCHDGVTAIGKDAKINPAHLATGLDCFNCHTTATFVGGTWIHDASATNQCDTCHRDNGDATPKPTAHLNTPEQCDVCHSTNGWAPTNFSHSPNGNYPGDHRRDPGCNGCHKGAIGAGENSDNYPNQVTYAPFCAGCHARDFKAKDKHIGGEGGTVEQNKNCAGSGCHRVSDSEF